jgi:uncharacterized membrane protein YbhN (UPF0104 family)
MSRLRSPGRSSSDGAVRSSASVAVDNGAPSAPCAGPCAFRRWSGTSGHDAYVHLILGVLASGLHRLAGVSVVALTAAVLLHLAKLSAEARAWHWIVSHAHDADRVRFRTTFGAFAGSIGANVVCPARVGDAFRVGVVRRHVPGSSVATIASTVVLETALELAFGVAVVAIVVLRGRSGSLAAPGPAVLFAHPLALAAIVALALLAVVFGIAYAERAHEVGARAAQGFSIIRSPRAFATRVLSWKLVAWALRVGSVYAFLLAFNLPASPATVLLVVAAQSVAAAVPLLPGNAGTQQAALILALAGSASTAGVLAFGVGMQAATAVADLAVGLAAVALVANRGDVRGTLGRRSRGQRGAGMLSPRQ